MFDLQYAIQRYVSKQEIIIKKRREDAEKEKREAEAKKMKMKMKTTEKKKKVMNEEVEEEKARQTKIAGSSKVRMDAGTSNQLPTQSHISQPSAGPSQPRRSSDLRPVAFTSFSTSFDASPPTATMSSTAVPDTLILHAGCCTPFLRCIGCVSVRHRNGHR